MADSFVHLHVHTEYSMLDGAARVGELIDEAADQEMPAVAMTDHGNVFGAYDFYRQAKAAGVKPIIGIEAYLTPGTDRRDRSRVRWGNGGQDDVSGAGAYTHMTLLSESTTGMHNLFRLSRLASLEGFYFKPRMDRELLQSTPTAHRHNRLPLRRGQTLAAARQVRRGGSTAAADYPRHLRGRTTTSAS